MPCHMSSLHLAADQSLALILCIKALQCELVWAEGILSGLRAARTLSADLPSETSFFQVLPYVPRTASCAKPASFGCAGGGAQRRGEGAASAGEVHAEPGDASRASSCALHWHEHHQPKPCHAAHLNPTSFTGLQICLSCLICLHSVNAQVWVGIAAHSCPVASLMEAAPVTFH